jgi:hypothetical protein
MGCSSAEGVSREGWIYLLNDEAHWAWLVLRVDVLDDGQEVEGEREGEQGTVRGLDEKMEPPTLVKKLGIIVVASR